MRRKQQHLQTGKRVPRHPVGILSLLLCVWLAGCTSDNLWPESGKSVTGSEIPVTFTLQIPSATTPKTYAISAIDENRVESVDIFAFKADKLKPSGWTFVYKAQGTSISDQTDDNPYKAKIQFRASLIKDETTPQLLVVLANVRSQIESVGNIAAGTDKDELLGSLIFTNTDSWQKVNPQGGGAVDFVPFPMWGETQVTVREGTQRITGMHLLRGIARIDVLLDEYVTGFSLDEVYVYNSKTKGQIVPATMNLEESKIKVHAATVPAGDINRDAPLKYITPTAMERAFERSIYLFEAKKVASDKPADATCLIIGGTFAADGRTTYYRIDFFQKDAQGKNTAHYRDILRNHRYCIHITAVSGSGYVTLQEAFNAKPFNMQAEMVELDDSDLTNVAFNEQYLLAVGPGELSLPCDAHTVAGDKNTFSVYTDYPGGWKIEKIVDAADGVTPETWLSVKDTDNGQADIKKKFG